MCFAIFFLFNDFNFFPIHKLSIGSFNIPCNLIPHNFQLSFGERINIVHIFVSETDTALSKKLFTYFNEGIETDSQKSTMYSVCWPQWMSCLYRWGFRLIWIMLPRAQSLEGWVLLPDHWCWCRCLVWRWFYTKMQKVTRCQLDFNKHHQLWNAKNVAHTTWAAKISCGNDIN